MTTKKVRRSRGRPRAFDPGEAVAAAQRMLHARGYDDVSVSDLTDALGINPPSFYAAFGNKAGLYARVLDRYADTDAIPLADLLRDDRSVAASLAAVLAEAARRYAACPEARGCLVLEGLHSTDPGARDAARAMHLAAEEAIRRYVAARHPADADRVTDYVSIALAGMSARARDGHDLPRLLAAASMAGLAIDQILGRGDNPGPLTDQNDSSQTGGA